MDQNVSSPPLENGGLFVGHTPGPWVVGYGEGLTGPTTADCDGPTVAGAEWGHEPISSGRDTVAICPNQVDPWTLRQKAEGSGRANAAFIVRAANAHDALVDALREIIGDTDFGCDRPSYLKARAALALAEAQP